MTDRLYYNDPYSREFDAAVVRVAPAGGHQAVWLDRSAFYPTSGGQPFDTGTLGGARVVDVVDEDGDVKHVIEGQLAEGDAVRGAIDWTRRFDHMQQHTGQHILSAAFVRRFGVATVSVHFGADASTIDLARELTAADIAAAEDDANRVIWENRAVAIRYAESAEAASLALRKASARSGTLRLIDIDQWDLSACGGTHVSTTAAVGLVAVSAWERFKGGQRLVFVCGGRALEAFRRLRDVNLASVRLLSATSDTIATAIERLQAEAREHARSVTTLEQSLAAEMAERLRREAETFAGGSLIVRVVPGSANLLKALASSLSAGSGIVAVLLSPEVPARIVVTRSADQAVSCADVVKRLTTDFGGRGGGRPDLAQAGGLEGDPEAILSKARSLIAGASA